MADEGLSGQAWLDNYNAGNSRMLSSDWTPGYATSGKPFTANNDRYNDIFGAKEDYSTGDRPVFSFGNSSNVNSNRNTRYNVNGSTSGDPYAYNPTTGYGYGRDPSTQSYAPARVPTRTNTPPPEWTQDFAKQSEFGKYTPEQQNILRNMAESRGSLQGPVPEQKLRDVAMSRYAKWTPEENAAGVQRVSDLEGYNAVLGRMGFLEGAKEYAGRLTNELPLIGRFTKAAGVAGGRNLIGNKPVSRAIRTGSDIASLMGGPGFSLIGLGLAGGYDLLKDTYWPEKPIAGLTGTENLQRMKLVNGQPTPKSFWED